MTNLPLPAEPIRCSCGRLMARRTTAGYELKCARCKTIWQLPFNTTAEVQLVAAGPAAAGASDEN